MIKRIMGDKGLLLVMILIMATRCDPEDIEFTYDGNSRSSTDSNTYISAFFLRIREDIDSSVKLVCPINLGGLYSLKLIFKHGTGLSDHIYITDTAQTNLNWIFKKERQKHSTGNDLINLGNLIKCLNNNGITKIENAECDVSPLGEGKNKHNHLNIAISANEAAECLKTIMNYIQFEDRRIIIV